MNSAATRARDERLGKHGRDPEPIVHRKPVLVFIRPDADYHVEAWRLWLRCQDQRTSAADYIKLRCRIAGVDHAEFMRKFTRRLHKFRKELLRELHARYPTYSSTRLGALINREHTTILFLLEKTAASKRLAAKRRG